MTGAAWETTKIATAPVVTAPDGSEVRILAASRRGSMAIFTLPPGAVAKPVAHRTVEEIWYVLDGIGRIWRRRDDRDEITDLAPAVSLTIPVGTRFQFRNDGDRPLSIVAVTMPPWPGPEEACDVNGLWQPSL